MFKKEPLEQMTQVYTGWMPFLLRNQQCQSTEEKPKPMKINHWCHTFLIHWIESRGKGHHVIYADYLCANLTAFFPGQPG